MNGPESYCRSNVNAHRIGTTVIAMALLSIFVDGCAVSLTRDSRPLAMFELECPVMTQSGHLHEREA